MNIGMQTAIDAQAYGALATCISILRRAIQRLCQGEGGGALAYPVRADKEVCMRQGPIADGFAKRPLYPLRNCEVGEGHPPCAPGLKMLPRLRVHASIRARLLLLISGAGLDGTANRLPPYRRPPCRRPWQDGNIKQPLRRKVKGGIHTRGGQWDARITQGPCRGALGDYLDRAQPATIR